MDLQILRKGGVGLGLGDIALRHQAIQGDLLPLLGLVGVVDGIHGRVLDDGCQHGALGQAQLLGMFAKVDLGGRLHTDGPVAIVVGVQVPLQDLVLGVEPRDLQGQDGLLDLASVRYLVALFLGDEDVLDQLDRDRAAALDALALQVQQKGAGDAHGIDAQVAVEGLVLQGDGGVAKVLGDLLQGQQRAVAAPGVDHLHEQDLAGAIIDLGRLELFLAGDDLVGVGQVLGIVGVYAGKGSYPSQEGKGHTEQRDQKQDNGHAYKPLANTTLGPLAPLAPLAQQPHSFLCVYSHALTPTPTQSGPIEQERGSRSLVRSSPPSPETQC